MTGEEGGERGGGGVLVSESEGEHCDKRLEGMGGGGSEDEEADIVDCERGWGCEAEGAERMSSVSGSVADCEEDCEEGIE